MNASLVLIAMPIGDRDTMSPAALTALKQADEILCESVKGAMRILKPLGINEPLCLVNEHNEEEQIQELISEMKKGKRFVMLSDHGMPALEDPGQVLIHAVWENGLEVSAISGSCSLISAIVLSGFPLTSFSYIGRPPRDAEKRRRFFKELGGTPSLQVFLDTPYRLLKTIQEVSFHCPERLLALVLDLETEKEKVFRGRPGEVLEGLKKKGIQKAEFVCVLSGNDYFRNIQKNQKKFDKKNRRKKRTKAR